MPYFLVRQPAAGERRVEVAPQCYKSRAEALAALKRQRGRWTIVQAPSWLEAAQQAERAERRESTLPFAERPGPARPTNSLPTAYTPLWRSVE